MAALALCVVWCRRNLAIFFFPALTTHTQASIQAGLFRPTIKGFSSLPCVFRFGPGQESSAPGCGQVHYNYCWLLWLLHCALGYCRWWWRWWRPPKQWNKVPTCERGHICVNNSYTRERPGDYYIGKGAFDCKTLFRNITPSSGIGKAQGRGAVLVRSSFWVGRWIVAEIIRWQEFNKH